MTDFDKIKTYYKSFNEKDRLINDDSGKLEFDMTMKILKKYLPKEGNILDLGGAAGVYTFPLSKLGYRLYLSDLSEVLINQAQKIVEEEKYKNVISCDVVNAVNLSIYNNEQFEVVLLFGPLYHLLESSERNKCLSEVYRVLKPGGLVFASFIPYLSGSVAIIDRYFRHPEQVNLEGLKEVFKSGKFNNSSQDGFQEGYYPTTFELQELFKDNKFGEICIRSVRGLGYEKEDKIFKLENREMLDAILEIIDETSTDKSILETCGHAMFIGKKI